MTELQIKVAKAWKATMKASRLMAKSKDRSVRRKWREEASNAQANIKIVLKDSSAAQKNISDACKYASKGYKNAASFAGFDRKLVRRWERMAKAWKAVAEEYRTYAKSNDTGVKLKKGDIDFISDWKKDLHLVYVSLALEDKLSSKEKKVAEQILRNMHSAVLRNKRYEDRSVNNIINALLEFMTYNQTPGFDEFKDIDITKFENWMSQEGRINKYVY